MKERSRAPEPTLRLPLGARARLWLEGVPLQVSYALAGRTVTRASAPTRDQITVALCQVQFALVERAAGFALKAYRFVRAAAQKGAHLVVFPQYFGSQLLGLLPGLLQHGASDTLERAAEKMGTTLGGLYRAAAPAAASIYTTAFSLLAERFAVTIAAGTLVQPGPDGRLFDVACLFGPKGTLLGRQRRLHVAPHEAEWLSPGVELRVFELPFAKVAMPIGIDHLYWETARLAWLGGAEILIDPVADPQGDAEWLAARGSRMRVQEAPMYAVRACMSTDQFALHWRGRSGAYAPTALLAPGQPALAQARGDKEEEVVVVPLDLAALRKLRRTRVPEFNPGLLAKYVPAQYHRPAS